MTPLFIKEIDKANHVIVGGLIYCAASIIMSPFIAFLFLAIVAGAKEIRDMYVNKTSFDTQDFIYSMVGGLAVFITLILN